MTLLTDRSSAATSSCWGGNPIALSGEVLRRRIYAPQAYAQVRNTAVIPVIHSESEAHAAWFPLVWRARAWGPEFVAIRALLDDQRAQPAAARALLPMVLHGYPFLLDPLLCPARDTPKRLDDVFADAPTDVGATITSVNHKLTRATVSRFRVLDRFAVEAEVTAAVGAALAERNLLTPWPLAFEIAGRQVGIPDLLMIRREAYETPELSDVLRDCGHPAAVIISHHRLSLFRAGGLLAAARAAMTRPVEEHDAERAPSLQPEMP